MYPFERFFFFLKEYVSNKAHSESSIAEDYIVEEGITFCSNYLEVHYATFDMHDNNPSSIDQSNYLFGSVGTGIGKEEIIVLDEKSLIQIHQFVLRHCDQIESYRESFVNVEKRKRRRHTHLTPKDVEKLINDTFHEWFRDKVTLARGPNMIAKRFSGYYINGFKFRTISRVKDKKTQNYGVVNTTEIGGVSYFGQLSDIFEIDYFGSFKVVLFKCNLANVTLMGIKRDDLGFTLVNFSRLVHTGEKLEHDPFVFSLQVEQVFYVENPKNNNWFIVIRTRPRDLFDMVKL
ncbi:hypothetical protein AXF42_Ash001168 [Apostasia shenzhenica]|uniref:DUF4216 domain-containing protein n=1 Tax=Apostasia shenzhenica TaxID=1088818 RepID=A0A2I0AU52_9ASPA|nr:hypothetical protein AXF42_Ash001168 [Apostasia shenzhenica]